MFRVWPDGGILAMFPNCPECNRCVMSYEHVGQHGGANYEGCIKITTPATVAEYTPLLRELESIGYSLEVIDG